MIVLVLTLVGLLGPVVAVPKPASDLELQEEDRTICMVWDDNFCLGDNACE